VRKHNCSRRYREKRRYFIKRQTVYSLGLRHVTDIGWARTRKPS